MPCKHYPAAMSVRARRGVAGVLVALVLACVTGCITKKSGTPSTPVVSHIAASTSPPPAVVSPTASVASSASGAAASPSAPVLPAGCSQLLPLGTLEKILGFGILGQVNYLKAAPVPQSGRTGRVTCSYGNSTGEIPVSPTASPSGKVTPLAHARAVAADLLHHLRRRENGRVSGADHGRGRRCVCGRDRRDGERQARECADRVDVERARHERRRTHDRRRRAGHGAARPTRRLPASNPLHWRC